MDEFAVELQKCREELARLTDEVKELRLLAQRAAVKFGLKV